MSQDPRDTAAQCRRTAKAIEHWVAMYTGPEYLPTQLVAREDALKACRELRDTLNALPLDEEPTQERVELPAQPPEQTLR